MIKILENHDEETNINIDICRSSSGISGYRLRDAHYQLGKKLASRICEDLDNNFVVVLCMMRSGLCFSLGIADALEKNGFSVKINFSTDYGLTSKIDNKYSVIVVDGVINTGNTILKTIKELNSNDILIASNVISEKARYLLVDLNVYAVRVSEKSFIGSMEKEINKGKGPDTSERLFDSEFF